MFFSEQNLEKTLDDITTGVLILKNNHRNLGQAACVSLPTSNGALLSCFIDFIPLPYYFFQGSMIFFL